MLEMLRDIRTSLVRAARHLRKSPLFTAIALLSLALGIGANTAVFSIVNALILRPTVLESPEELVDVYKRQEEFSGSPLSYPDVLDIRAASRDVFAGVSGSGYSFTQLDRQDQIEAVPVELVTGNYFEVLGVGAHVGRVIEQADETERASVAVLDYAHWQRDYGGDPDVVGREIRISGQPFVVVGVGHEEFKGNVRGLQPAFYVPVVLTQLIEPTEGTPRTENRGNHWFFTRARLLPGKTIDDANQVLGALGESHREAGLDAWQGEVEMYAMATNDVIMNPMIDRFIMPASSMLLVVVGLVLVIACSNLASFLLARAAARRRDLAVQLALGASRGVLVRQLLVETVMLGLLGGALGVGLSTLLLRALTAADLPLPLPITLDLSLDLRVLVFSLVLSMGAGLLFGLLPAVQSSRHNVVATLKDEGTGGGPPRLFSARNLLVTAQVAVSTLLLIGAGLFLRSLAASERLDPGLGDRPTGLVSLFLASDEYTREEALRFVERATDEFGRLPGVESVGWIDNLPLSLTNTSSTEFNVDGLEPPEGKPWQLADVARIDEGYLLAAGVEIVAGRNFERRDDLDAPRVAIVSETFAERFFPGRDAVGQPLRRDGPDLEIVGIARDTRVRTLGEAPRPYLYLPLRQSYSAFVTAIARADGVVSDDWGDKTALAMVAGGRRLDPDLRVIEAKTLERHIAAQLLGRRASALFLGAFAALALLLAATGLVGVVSYSVTQRAREVGIRVSLGARPLSLVALLMRKGLVLVVVGAVLGLAAGAAMTKSLSSLLFGVEAWDVTTFVGVPLLLLLVAGVATLIPALRAARIDPVRVLRGE